MNFGRAAAQQFQSDTAGYRYGEVALFAGHIDSFSALHS